MTEDTTAQLREQIAETLHEWHRHYFTDEDDFHGSMTSMADAVMPIVLAQVATTRDDAYNEGASEQAHWTRKAEAERDEWKRTYDAFASNWNTNVDALAKALVERDEALAQVEAAKATARRDALLDTVGVLGHFAAEGWSSITREDLIEWLRALASAQGVAPPAEVIATAVIPANTIRVGDRINFKGSGG